MKKSLSLLAVLVFSFSLIACDGDNVRSEMQMMGRYNSALISAGNVEEFHNASENLQKFSVEAMNKRPSTIKSDEEFKDYQQGMQYFIDVVQQADQLAQQGKFEEAKALAKQLIEMKNQYHAEFKNK